MERQPVGIDGDGSRDVLQAGTEQEIVSFGFITVHATYAAPPKTEPRGNCAEWIVEVPTVNGSLGHLARYGDVYFDNCIAGTRGHDLLYAGSGDLVTMVDSGNHAISTPLISWPVPAARRRPTAAARHPRT